VTGTVEFNPGGSGKTPHTLGAEREHERDLRETAERDRAAAEAARATNRDARGRRWWVFWRKRDR
jgi:hypothetical protein